MTLNFYNQLFDSKDNLLIAFSGGADSVACLHYLSTIHNVKKLSAFYLNHGLRKEADFEVIFCEKFCKKLGIKFYTNKVDITALAHEQKKSIEQTGREVRYANLAELANLLFPIPHSPSTKIVTAHHLDDQVETILMQIFSGTSGLRIGISKKTIINGIEVIRPLLHETKENIIKYCEDNQLSYVTDESNFQNDFKRNKLRNIVLPMIKQTINPSVEKSIERFKDISDEMSSFIDEQLDIIEQQISLGLAYDLEVFLNMHPFLQKEFLKRELLNKSVFITAGLLNEIITQLKSDKPNIVYDIGNSVSLVKEYNVFKISNHERRVETNFSLSYGENILEDTKITIYLDTMCVVDKEKKNLVCLDADKVNIETLIIRKRKIGDSFIPLGMTGRKKLKDYFIDKKVSVTKREKALVIEDIEGIIWLVGYEIDDRVKITEETKKILVIEYTLPSQQS